MVERTDEAEREADLDELLDESGTSSTDTVGDAGDLSDLEVDGTGDAELDDDLGVEGDLGVDDDLLEESIGGSDSGGGGSSREQSGGILSRLSGVTVPSGLPSIDLSELFTVRSFGLSLGATVVAMVGFSVLLPFGGIGGLLGVFTAAFVFGLVSGRRRYFEFALAGGLTAAVSLFFGQLFISVMGDFATEIAAIGAGGGVLTALIGHYLGRDVRDGFTREV